MPMQKLFCYVDETGQDTKGRLFIVSVVVTVTAADRDELATFCEALEETTGKGKLKWGKADMDRRLSYLRGVFRDPRFAGSLRYVVFRRTSDYDRACIQGVAQALHGHSSTPYAATVYIDALAETKRYEYTRELRQLGVTVEKVRGVAKDENSPLTRLADAVAGFVRDVLEGIAGKPKILFESATRRGVLVEL